MRVVVAVLFGAPLFLHLEAREPLGPKPFRPIHHLFPENEQNKKTGADPTAEDGQGKSALQVAREGGAPRRLVHRIEVCWFVG